jgi:paraquat-inducible protein B
MNDAAIRARRSRQTSLAPIWIVPVVALLIGLWLVYDNLQGQGPQITLEIADAEGIVAGNTLIKLLNVEVGRVEQVSLSEDLSHTLITARMTPAAERMLMEDTRFWVVKPRIGREGISGLNTVLSGAYIQVQPGQGERITRRFTVLDQPPLSGTGAQGLRIRLDSELGNSLRVGDPVSFQGFTVGRVEEAVFDAPSREMQHRLFIESPYDALITDNTRFWKASGIDLRLDSEGIRLGVESLEALLVGGVTFGYLEDDPGGPRVEEDSSFNLYPDQESAMQASFYQYLEYVVLIDTTVRGLAAGSPVEYRGIRVGTVVSAPWNFSVPEPGAQQQLAIPVLIRIEPQRFDAGGVQTLTLTDWEARFEALFAQGLRATLRTGNLLTGALFVDINVQPELPDNDYVPGAFANRTVFPSTSSGLAQIEGQITALLDKLNRLEVEPVLARMEQSLDASRQMLGEVQSLSKALQELVAAPTTQALPATFNTSLQELRTTLEGFAPGSAAYQELNNSLQGIDRLLRDMQPLVQTLGEQPNALIFNRAAEADPEPRAPRQ